METTAFRALQGTLDYQLGHLRNVAKLKKIGGHLKIPVVLTNFLEQIFNTRLGAQQAFARTNDAHVIPHTPADFIPVMAHHHEFIRVFRRAGMPARQRQIRRRLRLSQDRLGRTMGTD